MTMTREEKIKYGMATAEDMMFLKETPGESLDYSGLLNNNTSKITGANDRSFLSTFLNPDGVANNGELFGTNPFSKMGMFGKEGFFSRLDLGKLGDIGKVGAGLFNAYNANRQFGLDKQKQEFFQEATLNQLNNNTLQANKDDGRRQAGNLNQIAMNMADGGAAPSYTGAYNATGFQGLGNQENYGPSSGTGSAMLTEYPKRTLS